MSQPTPDRVPGVPRRGRRRFLAVLLFGGALLAGGTVLAFWLAHSAPPPPPPQPDAADMDPAVVLAVTAARDRVVQSPRSAEAWGNLGLVLLGNQLNPEAAECFVQAERLADRQARWPYLRALAVRRTDPETASVELRRALERSGDAAGVARLRLAELLLEQGRLEEAAGEFHRALEARPDDARAHLGLARVESQSDELPACLTDLERVAADPYARKAAAVLRAEVHQRLGDAAAADRDLRAAKDLPEDAPWPDPLAQEAAERATGLLPRAGRANQLLMEDRVPEAVASLQDLVQDYPDAAHAWFLLGKGLIRENNLAGAEAALRRATRLAPAGVEYQYDLGTVLFQRGQLAAAADCFRRATRLKPDFARAYYNLGHCLKQQGDRAGAQTAFRDALRCEPRLPAAHANLGELLAEDGHTDEALAHLRQAVEGNPDDAHARQQLADLQKRLADPARP